METTRLSSKGQVVLPRAVRAAKAWKPGQALEVVSTPEGVLLKPLGAFAATRLEDVAGSLGGKGRARTIAQMDEAIAAEARRRK